MLDDACSHLRRLCAGASTKNLDRGQISSTSPLTETRTYGNVFSGPHARELLDAAKRLDLSQRLNGGADVLDFGCGHGLSLYALQDSGLKVHSYQGYDHNPNMITDAAEIAASLSDLQGHCGSVSFHSSARGLRKVEGTCLILLNHLLGQRTVSEGEVESWCDLLDRTTGSTLSLMILDVDGFSDQMRNQSYLLDSLVRPPRRWRISYTVEGYAESHSGRRPKRYLLATVSKPRVGS
jgi:SAM-dependent methyltransferase